MIINGYLSKVVRILFLLYDKNDLIERRNIMVIQNSSNMIKPSGSSRGAYSNLNLYFQEVVNCYYKHTSEISLKDSTVSTRANAGARFLLFLQEKSIKSFTDITESDVIDYLRQGRSGVPYGRSHRFSLCSFLNEISSEYHECLIVMNWIPKIRATRKNIQYLSEEEIKKIRNVCSPEYEGLSLCTKAVGNLLLYNGLRACDIATIQLEDINWNDDVLHVIQNKTGIPLTLPLMTIVGNALFDYITKERNSDQRTLFVRKDGIAFQSIDVSYLASQIFRSASIRQNKGDRKGTHIFRHHVATKLLENNVSRPVISQILGHTNPSSVEIYLSADMNHLRDCALDISEYPIDWGRFENV